MRVIITLILTHLLLTSIYGQDYSISYFRYVYTIEDENQSYENIFIYPQIKGLESHNIQDSLNANFIEDLKNFKNGLKQETDYYKVNVAIDSNSTSKFSHITSEIDRKQNWMVTEQKITVDIIQEKYLNIQSISQMTGNMAAHGNFSFHSRVVDISKNSQVTLNDIIQSEQLENFKTIAKKRLTIGDSTLNCNGILVLDNWVSSFNLNTPINYFSDEYLILSTDTRKFGCAEAERGIMEIKINLNEIKK